MPKSFVSSLNTVDQGALSRYRPAMPKGLHRAIYEYHTDMGSGWFRAWDVVTGDGSLPIELARYFNSVWSTSPNPTVTGNAISVLSTCTPASAAHASNLEKISFLVRDPSHGLPSQAPSSIDTAAIANSIHTLPNPEKVIAAAADMLKSGGTLAVWVTGIRFFFMEDVPSQAQGVWDAALEKWAGARGKEAKQEMELLAGRLEGLAFPSSQWDAVKRVHYNPTEPMVLPASSTGVAINGHANGYTKSEVSGLSIPTPTRTSTDEVEVENVTNKEFLTARVDLDWMVSYLQTLDEKVEVAEVCGEEFVKLESVLGGRTKKCKIGWGLDLVLGTRR